MKIYTIDSVNPLIGDYESYRVLCGFEDQSGRYGAIAIMANEELSKKIQSLSLYDRTKYTRVDVEDTTYIIPEIILKDCDANFLAENPDVQIEHLAHDGTMQGISALLSSRADVADIIKQMLMPISGHNFKTVPIYRKDFLYLLKLDTEDAFEVVGYNMGGEIKNLGALSFDASALRFLQFNNIRYCGHLKLSEDKTGVTVIPTVSLADVTNNVEYFHIIPKVEDDEDYKYFTSSAISFEMTNIIHEDDLSYLKKFTSFTQTSDPMAVSLIKAWKCDKIYTASINNNTYIMGISRNGIAVTLKDIVHLKSAYLLMVSILGCKDTDVRVIFGSVDDKPTIKIPYIVNHVLQEKIDNGDVNVIDVTQMPIGEFRSSLLADYKEVCELGIDVIDLTKLEAGGTGAESALKALCNTFDEDVNSVEQFTLYDHFYEAADSSSDRSAYDRAIKNLINVNKTIEQPNCTSTLNRELPTLEQLLLIFGSDVVTDKFDLVENTNIFSNDGVIEDDESESEDDMDPCYGDLEMSIDLAHMPLNAKPMSTTGTSGVGKYFDSVCYKDIYKLVGSSEMASPECIEGNNANNMLPIQSNEVMFYAGLRRLVLEGLCLENNLYTIADLKAALVAGKRSRIVDAFLVCLAKDIFSLNWRHTGGVQVLRSELTEVRDLELYVKKSTAHTNIDADDFQGADTFICLGEYTVVKNAGEFSVVHKNLSTEPQDYFGSYTKGFINGAANSLAWVEAVIRLARWNSRKPAMLWIPCKRDPKQSVENEQFLSLQTFTIQTWCGVFDSTKKIYFVDPFDPNSKSEFILHSRIAGSLDAGTAVPNLSEFLTHYKLPELERKGAELIYGVALDTFYENTDATHTSYIDIFTFEKAVAEKHLAVFGLRFNESTQKFEETEGEVSLGDGEFSINPTSYFYDLYDTSHPECKSLKEVIARVTENCTENTVMPSAHIMQWTQFLKTLLPGDVVATLGKSEESANSDKSKDTGIFDILNLFGIFSSRNLQCCANAMTDSDAQATLTATFKKPETILKALIFEKIAVSYLRLALEVQKFVKENDRQPKVSEVLTMARLIHQTENSFRSNIVNTQGSTSTDDLFISKYNACQHFYSYTATAGGSSATIYLGEEKLGNQSKYIFWEEKDVAELESRIGKPISSDITQLSIKEFTSVITPYWNKLREIQKKVNLQTSLAELRSMKRDTFVSYTDSVNSIKDTLSVFLASKWQPAYRAYIEASKEKT